MPGSHIAGKIPGQEQLHVTLRLRARAPVREFLETRQEHLSREELGRRFGAQAADLERIEEFARQHRLDIVAAHPARRSVVLGGTSAAFGAAFHVRLVRCVHPDGSYRSHEEPVGIPASLAGIVEGVFGLDNRPQARRFPGRRPGPSAAGHAQAGHTVPQLARLYNFPSTFDGTGQTIAILALGGGFLRQDLAAYFSALRLPHPRVSWVSVHGVRNKPRGRTRSSDGEVTGDIETAGGAAPGAHLVVYFAPNSEQGFLDAVSAAVHDRRHRPSILSISWGQSESAWARQTLRAIDEVFAEAAAMGMTVFCASGDLGSANGVPGGAQHVNFPASSPYVLGCGGTSLAASGGHIVNETVWNDALGASGGGVSAVFPVPEWQRRAGVPASANPGGHRGRGVPDIAATAEGYRAFIEGSWGVGHGTSAVAPLFAGLMARINQKLRRPAGYLNPLLYRQYGELLQLGALREITAGRNGAYRARKGWDACTGLGSPRGAALAAVLGKRL